ncbi:ATP synthase membrane subunit DAPIT, mitochondrial [Chelonus insularis]|uniref:ATP synthase membrane subunit DAPIT, mitochondrial n=1 Tax=Chelonus insularis TaxID=460826 RepID=UPI00158F4EEB|nr:ATP synthase membrane subunit DAPIT, mitochondrial [Chelonus insularis]
MANEGENFTGIKKYFNSTTDYGRANTSKLTLSLLGIAILYNVLKPKKKPAVEK